MLANQKACFNIPVKPAHKFLKGVVEQGENVLGVVEQGENVLGVVEHGENVLGVVEHGENVLKEVVSLQGEQGGSILEHEILTRDEEDDDDVDRETYIDNDMMVDL